MYPLLYLCQRKSLKMPRIYVLSLIHILMLSISAYAQPEGRISGQVWDSRNELVINAEVRLDTHTARTDDYGRFIFRDIPAGKHTLKVSLLGHQPFIHILEKHALEDLQLDIHLKSSNETLKEVQVRGKSENQRIREQSIHTLVLDIRALTAQASSLADLMNQHTGIRIRQSGGLGSRPEISINGFQGRSIQYFRDGIPLDYLGEGYNIASLPLEALERVEVYKGVLPVNLGADALGGAVNYVSRRQRGSDIHAYYELGSFNTHRAGLKGYKVPSEGGSFLGGEFYFNYSDNDYKAEVDVVDPQTRNISKQKLPLFHNAFKHYYAEVYAGLQDRSWVDELRLSLAAFTLEREQQHPALMTDPYGALASKQHTLAPSLRFKKAIDDGRLSMDHFIAYNDLQTQRTDTLHGRYNWFGEFSPRTSRGESRLPSLSEIHQKQWTARSAWGYKLNPWNKLNFNYVFLQIDRSGKDPYGPRLEGTEVDVLSLPSMYQKQVLGLSWDGVFLGDKLEQTLIGKFYHYKSEGIQNTWFSAGVGEQDRTTLSGHNWGLAEALKYQLGTSSTLRGSLEFAYRLPQRDELFGNNVFIVPNFELDPERSLNVNLGYEYQDDQGFFAGINGFYRRTRNMILLVPIQAPNAQYQNQENIKGFGVDLDVSYPVLPGYTISGNASWQDLRIFGISALGDLWKNQARLRNTPYFFANLDFKADYKKLFSSQDRLQVWLHYNFMREFYLETLPRDQEPGGFLGLSGHAGIKSDLIIPDQHILDLRSTYHFSKLPVTLGLSIQNILNAQVFDYYRIPRPGRNLHLKLSYHFTQYNN